ncbi:helix-turn-helix domain-containing protein [Burkholderia sp. 22313]|uniref:helix-turn-helix domain-containing protein n=1 Tax=Burkholderia sp. 22313 TaxID=3453908 RepID=UPI003F86C8EC
MDIHPIRSEADYEAALKAVSALVDLDPAQGTPEGDALESMAILIVRYEAEHFPLASPNPIDAIELRMEQAGFAVADCVRQTAAS